MHLDSQVYTGSRQMSNKANAAKHPVARISIVQALARGASNINRLFQKCSDLIEVYIALTGVRASSWL